MRTTLACVLSGCVLLTAGSAMLAAPEQDRPGQMTQAKVWVQNRGKAEALPVQLQEVAAEALLHVQVTGTPIVAIDGSSVVQTRLIRQPWEYRMLTVMSGEDAGALLSNAGRDGWEAAGLQLPVRGGTALLLKRPR